MRLSTLLITLLLTFSSQGFSNNVINSDSTRTFFPESYGEKRWKVLIGLDARRSFYNKQKIKINGLRLGAQFKGVHRFGLGFYALSEQIRFDDIEIDQIDAANPTNLLVDVNFTTLFYERVFYKSNKWEVSFPLYLASGQLKTQYLNNLGNYKLLDKTPFSALGLSAGVKYYVLPWLAPRFSLGYRLTYNTNDNIRRAFNKPFYAIGLSIEVGKLYKSIFKKES
jgi:hypothetical protein